MKLGRLGKLRAHNCPKDYDPDREVYAYIYMRKKKSSTLQTSRLPIVHSNKNILDSAITFEAQLTLPWGHNTSVALMVTSQACQSCLFAWQCEHVTMQSWVAHWVRLASMHIAKHCPGQLSFNNSWLTSSTGCTVLSILTGICGTEGSLCGRWQVRIVLFEEHTLIGIGTNFYVKKMVERPRMM